MRRAAPLVAALLSLLLIALATPSVEAIEPSGQRATELSDAQVGEIMAAVRKELPHAWLDNQGTPVPPETEAELALPIMSIEEGRLVIDAGLKSAFAAWCGLDWQSHYLGFMQGERAREIWSNKQLAFIGMLHGTIMQSYGRMLSFDGATCPADIRASVRQYLDSRH